MDEVMPGGYNSAPVRRGDTVRRAVGPWSPNVHALLRHLERAGFDRAPRFLAADNDSETLTFVDGAAGTYPVNAAQRSTEALVDVARTIRAMHDATRGFVAPEPGNWQTMTSVPAEIDCIGHNDLGPYNMVFSGPLVAAIIDWDFAGPSSRVWDLAYAAHRFVPLSAPRSTKAFGWDPVPDQGARLRHFAAAYGDDISPAELLDVLIVRLGSIAANIERQVRLGNPAYFRQRDERHCDAYREDMRYILRRRDEFLGLSS